MPAGKKPFVDTWIGRASIAVFGAVAALVVTKVGGWFEPRPPVAAIAPAEVAVPAGETVQFSAADSRDPRGGELALSWAVGGVALERSPVARCTPNATTLGCRFTLPGTFAVTVTAASPRGLRDSASATVTVAVEDGYFGLVVLAGSAEAQRDLLYSVDWPRLQQAISRPIVLFDPDRDAPVYAVSVEAPSDADDAPWRGAAQGLEILLPAMPAAARALFVAELQRIGASVTAMPRGDVQAALTAGAADSGFFVFDSPQALVDVQRGFEGTDPGPHQGPAPAPVPPTLRSP